MRILGIDYGQARIGLAIGDTDQGIAFPRAVEKNEWEHIVRIIKIFIDDDNVEAIVVGIPRFLSGEASDMTREAENFAKKLEARFSLPVYHEDERLSTKAVQKGTVSKEHIDASSAALILQQYLDRKYK